MADMVPTQTTTHIALFRGINVGGSNILPMKELVSVLVALGFENIQTYIQSGNVVFQSPMTDAGRLSQTIKDAVGESHGFAPEVLILSIDEFRDAVAGCPYSADDPDPKTLHVSFLESTPSNPDLDRLEAVRSPAERFHLSDRFFYLLAPDGIGRSRLAGKVERALGVTATSRNWRTVSKLMSMALEINDPGSD